MNGDDRRVNYDDIDYTNDGCYVYESELFTGIGYEIDDSGNLVCEIPIVDGQQHGPARDYYSSGVLKGETPYENGLKHGLEREWYENGYLKAEREFEFDVLMRSRAWDNQGDILDEYERQADDHLFQLVVERRSAKK